MPKLYILEIVSLFMAAILLAVDCRHMLMEPPKVTAQVAYLLAPHAAGIERTDVIRQLNGLSMLMSVSADHPAPSPAPQSRVLLGQL